MCQFSNFFILKTVTATLIHLHLKEEKNTGFLLVCLSKDITFLIESHHLLTLGPLWEKN